MTDLHDAIGMLLRQHTMTIHYLPGQPEHCYRVRAPNLLQQLADAVANTTTGRGGRTIPTSRLPLDAGALQLWTDIHLSVHGWARELGIDRRPYVAQARDQAAELDREPGWIRVLRPWLRPVAWDEPLAQVTAVDPMPTPELQPPPRIRIAPTASDMPPVGRLLRITAAAAATKEDITRTITRRSWCGRQIVPADCRAGCWTHRIQAMLADITEDRAIRGASCWVCRTSTGVDEDTGTETFEPTKTTTMEQDGEKLRVPAIVVRVAELPGAGPDDLWIYRMCRACGAEGWLDYTTTTDTPHPAEGEMMTA